MVSHTGTGTGSIGVQMITTEEVGNMVVQGFNDTVLQKAMTKVASTLATIIERIQNIKEGSGLDGSSAKKQR